MSLRLAFCAALLLAGASAGAAEPMRKPDPETSDAALRPSAPISRRDLMLPGDPARPVTLDVTLLTPSGPGPFPVILWNHGSANGAARRSMATSTNTFATYYFLSRGYAVAAPMMRGFGRSGGDVSVSGCALDAYGAANAADILAVLDGLARDPTLDMGRVVVAGQSFGGFNALATGARRDPRIRAVIDFHGGLRATTCRAWEPALIEAARGFGARSRVPSLWIYGDNDRFFPAATWRAMRTAYASGGAPVEVVAYGRFRDDSHTLLASSDGLPLFAPRLDAFLAGLGLPSAATHPEYLPTPSPPPSGYAAIDDVEAVPHLTPPARDLYRTFLTRPIPRVFVIAPGRHANETYGGFDPLARALAECRALSMACKVYAVNRDVVWTQPSSVPPPSGFAAIDDVGAVPYLTEAGRTGYRRFLAMDRPRAFVIAPGGAWGAAASGTDPLSTLLDGCRAKQLACRPYAVDGQVVWTEPKAGASSQ
ncbi:alpha/beta hydrolase family protein [Methylobacterium sp. SyP6R]|uniref:alpha/beta hydrolase family protein n=1 Tax=Methylobacterium sp. SyP6R TaxID=2718876 RepID=UPI001F01885E|nr:CocE/NonD family hydrolase [Methylobacterium sp. SyP6R]MCF4126206.1 prolyl oligopeptidase family serine peptidase [Methylobacterium sp. SyP6R]